MKGLQENQKSFRQFSKYRRGQPWGRKVQGAEGSWV